MTESSSCQTWSSKLCVTRLLPNPFAFPLPAFKIFPTLRASNPFSPLGFPFPIPIEFPNAPTPETKLEPVFRVIWLQPNRASFTRLGLMVRVQSTTVFQIGAVEEPLPMSGCEFVLGLFKLAAAHRQRLFDGPD